MDNHTIINYDSDEYTERMVKIISEHAYGHVTRRVN